MTQTVELKLIEPYKINSLKFKMPFKSSNLKDKMTNTDYSCFDAKVNDVQNESELSTSDENIEDNDASATVAIMTHMQQNLNLQVIVMSLKQI